MSVRISGVTECLNFIPTITPHLLTQSQAAQCQGLQQVCWEMLIRRGSDQADPAVKQDE